MKLPRPPYVIPLNSEAEWLAIKPILQQAGISWKHSKAPDYSPVSDPHIKGIAVRYSRNRQPSISTTISIELSLAHGNPTLYSAEEFLTLTGHKPLTNEQILIQFLKHHRKFAKFKRHFLRYVRSSNTPTCSVDRAFLNAFPWYHDPSNYYTWVTLNKAWRKLVRKFNLTGQLDLLHVSKQR